MASENKCSRYSKNEEKRIMTREKEKTIKIHYLCEREAFKAYER